MANYLKVSMQKTIEALSEKGWSRRRIARELGVNRRTVSRYIAQKDSKCTISTAGFSAQNTEGELSKCTIVKVRVK